MIVDTHMHIFPFLGGESGWGSVKKHLAAWQTILYGFARGKPIEDRGEGAELADINFHVGKMGRFEWTEKGQDYYFQFMPPSMQEQIAPPEFILAQMEHAGVDMAILHNAKNYGKLNAYFSEAVIKYPDKFIGLLEIDELSADQEREIRRLRQAVQDLRLKGIYYEGDRFYAPGYPTGFNDQKFNPFWKSVEDLAIPVYWSILTPRLSVETYMERMNDFATWAKRFPHIPSILVMGFLALPFRQEDGKVKLPRELLDIYKCPNVYQEITYPIQVGPLGWDYPFSKARELIRQQYEELGPEKLLWGSDMPNVERNCTYHQSLTYLKDYCDFINSRDMDLILGGNAARLHQIKGESPKTVRPKLATVA